MATMKSGKCSAMRDGKLKTVKRQRRRGRLFDFSHFGKFFKCSPHMLHDSTPSPPHILRFTFSARFSTPFSGSLAKYLCKSSVGHLWTVKHSQRNSNEFDTL